MKYRHGVKTQSVHLSFFSFKGSAKVSTLDQITLPPAMGMDPNSGCGLFHRFGEWLKREGHDWESLSEERLCQLGNDYWDLTLGPGELPRRFDRLATEKETP